MSILGEVFKELLKMFVADFRLTLAILGGVGVVAILIGTGAIAPLIGGPLLILLCAAVLIEAVLRETRHRARK
jgi:hypothetical protein